VIAGPDECNHLAEVKAAVVKANLQQEVAFHPDVWDEAKYDLYRESDLFVLPSYSESFGLVVAESLACGVPVITTRTTPWQDLVTERCGWWIDVGIEPLVEALRVATSCSPESLCEMGMRARQLVLRRYSWEGIALQTACLMEWILGRGARPDFVVT
jgi:glycosyltransferase involved in cell wall biosynthesis